MVTFTVYYIIIFDCVPYFLFQVILGKVVRFPTSLDEQLQKQLLDCSGEILTATGNTMCTHDFYEGKMMFHNQFKFILQKCSWMHFSCDWQYYM